LHDALIIHLRIIFIKLANCLKLLGLLQANDLVTPVAELP
jgi:hypothetical protein